MGEQQVCEPGLPCLLGENTVVSQWRQPAQTGSSGRLTKGLPEVVGAQHPGL